MSTAITKIKRKLVRSMSEIEDARKLAELLKQQRELAIALKQLRGANEIAISCDQLHEIRHQCIELVDRYFRQALLPILAKRFPGYVTYHADKPNKQAPVNVVVQFTQLLNDFFIQVLSTFDDEFWKKRSAIELRNYASIAISRQGVLNALRRRKKQEPLNELALELALDDQFAADFEDRFRETGIDPADAMEIIQRWNEGDDRQRRHAMVLRLYYVTEMTDSEVQDDLQYAGKLTDEEMSGNLAQSEDSREIGLPLKDVADRLETSVASASRWRIQALKAVRNELKNRV